MKYNIHYIYLVLITVLALCGQVLGCSSENSDPDDNTYDTDITADSFINTQEDSSENRDGTSDSDADTDSSGDVDSDFIADIEDEDSDIFDDRVDGGDETDGSDDGGNRECEGGPPVHCLLEELAAPFVVPSGAPGKAIGLVVGVAKLDARYVTGFGATTIGGNTPPDGDSIFEIASVTKVYSGYLLARAIQNGEVTLDDSLENTFNINTPIYGDRSINLLDLATHTSGLPEYPNNLLNPGPGNPAAGYTVELLEEFLASYTLTVEPGTRFLYSNLGSGILGHILVTASGETSFETLVQREISIPYELTDTLVNLSPLQQQRKLQGYAQGTPVPAIDIGEPLQGGGALKSTGNEVLQFFEGAITGDDPAWVNVMTPNRESPNGLNAYTGFLLNIEDPGGETIYSKNGIAPGFTSQVMFTMDPPAVVVLLSNMKHTAELYPLARAILEELKTFSDF